MATSVPNRYYNSPYIAMAAQNLSDALFGNPETEYRRLQMDQIEANMARAAEQDRIAREDRASTLTGMRNLSDAFAGVTYDEKGNPMPEALNRLGAAAAMIPGLNPVQLIAPYGRLSGIGLQNQGALERVITQEEGDTTRTTMTEEGKDRRLDTTEAGKDRRLDVTETGKNERAAAEWAARERMNDKVVAQRAAAAATKQGRQPVVIQGRVLTDIKRGVDAGIEASGAPMTPEERAELIAQIGEDVQTTRNVPLSVQRVWDQKVSPQLRSRWPGAIGDVLRTVGLDPQKEYLNVESAGSAPTSMGDVLAPAATGEGAPPAAAPAEQLPPAALQQLKEGKITTFANGQRWTLRQGAPVRVP